jgi:hypothetical protein
MKKLGNKIKSGSFVVLILKQAFTCKAILPICFVLISFNLPTSSFAQDSSHIRVSLLTCTVGDEIYSTFGHSALRVTDSSSVSDIVFNYGTFNFDEPDFYTKFIRGKLLYYVSTMYFKDFKDEYQSTNRGITEQVLNLSASEKIALEQFLYNNVKEENKYYRYDFFLDNCTTRIRDIIVKYKTNYAPLKPILPENTTFRQAIHQHLSRNGKYWIDLGIDILFGLPSDAIMTTSQTQFLPDNLMLAIDSSNQDHELIVRTSNLYPFTPYNNKLSFFTPLIVFSLLLIAIIVLSLSTHKAVIAFLHGFDGLLFFFTGAIGILFVFIWVATDHVWLKNNLNLLWAWPMHVVIAFFVNNKSNWVKKYFAITSIGLIVVLISWLFLPQQMNNALLPIVLLLLYRSIRKYQAI